MFVAKCVTEASLKSGLLLSLFCFSAAAWTPLVACHSSTTPLHPPKQPLLQSTCQGLAWEDYWC